MKNFLFYTDRVEIALEQGQPLVIYFNTDSGKIFFRKKINTVFNVTHPGIYVGIDAYGQHWFIHNHFEDGRPNITTEDVFRKGQPYYLSEEPCINSSLQIIANGLQQVIEGKPYDGILYNCQTFVNQAVNNRSSSKAVTNIFGGLLLTTLAIAGITVASKSK